MPNGVQLQAEEEEGSGGESQEEWESDADEGEEDAGSDEEEERRKLRLLVPKGGPSSPTTLRPNVARESCLLGSQRNVLRQLHRR